MCVCVCVCVCVEGAGVSVRECTSDLPTLSCEPVAGMLLDACKCCYGNRETLHSQHNNGVALI